MKTVSYLVSALENASIGLSVLAENQFQRLREAVGDARVVLIGEETHGTQEFYRLRAEITKALVEKEGFSLVLCESDFPTFYNLHRFVGGAHSVSRESRASSSSSASAVEHPSVLKPLVKPASAPEPSNKPPTTAEEVMEVLKERFPVWMWRNEVVRDFVEWLQRENLRRELLDAHNDPRPIPVALFGLDIYSMFGSTDQVVSYLDAVDPAMAERARKRYAVLQHFRPHEEHYCRAVLRGQVPPQHNPIRKMLQELQDKATEFKHIFGDGDEYFNAHENARVVVAAEEYYRQSYFGGSMTWNIRDKAMVEMIVNALQLHDEKLQQAGQGKVKARAVVWAHNSHIGDASATEQYTRWGQVNVGHLVREALGEDQCFLIGLSTATGTIRAARGWNGRDYVMELNPPLPGSIGDLLHQVSQSKQEKDFALLLRSNSPTRHLSPEDVKARDLLTEPRLERFIGVQYLKSSELQSHYSQCQLSKQFDMVIHLEQTSALRPLPEVLEPHLPLATTTTSMHPVEQKQWDALVVQDDDEASETDGLLS
ncbi:hypothetical protein Poli38472_013008 [Pythium oligandrum]|uniref:Erythromycin esterase n=1 Tax=Pythium oligandrum TaxID=41045 RepID=A0A8K1CIU1_PYTOL|nr:hypothetical protein Poli38472_013008 [Pythium oligandrum]|eukprot:TMW64386.1 hypothetical protein Poli38472_013008 [Pythium oligandrum]